MSNDDNDKEKRGRGRYLAATQAAGVQSYRRERRHTTRREAGNPKRRVQSHSAERTGRERQKGDLRLTPTQPLRGASKGGGRPTFQAAAALCNVNYNAAGPPTTKLHSSDTAAQVQSGSE